MTTPHISDPRAKRDVFAELAAASPAVDDTLFTPQPTLAQVQAAAGKHPIGFNVRPGIDYAKLLTQVKTMGGCRAMLFHCDASALHRLHDFVPYVDTIIWRPNEWVSEELFKQEPNAEKWVFDRSLEITGAGFALGDLWLHLHNEPGWSSEMIEWERRAIAHAITFNMKVVALNQAVGNPHEAQVHMAETILVQAAKRPQQVMIGIHDGYFPVVGDRGYPWLQGRWQATTKELNGGHSYESLRQHLKLGTIRYVMTEAGGEDVPSERSWTSTLPKHGDQLAGPVHASEGAWQHLYGAAYQGKDAQYLVEIQKAWDVGKWGDARIAGVCLYSWGAGGGKWQHYDVSVMGAFLTDLAKWKPEVAVPDHWADPEDGTMPIEDYQEVVAVLRNMGGALTLTVRKDRSVTSTPLGSIRAGDTIGVQPAEPGQTLDGGRGNLWIPVAFRADDGTWQTGHVHSFYLEQPPKPPPVEQPPPIEEPPVTDQEAITAAWKLITEGFRESAKQKQELAKAHEAMQKANVALALADDKIAQGYQALVLLQTGGSEEAA